MNRISIFLGFALEFCLAGSLAAQERPVSAIGVDTSRVMGSPNPLPPMDFERAFPDLQIASPVQPTHSGDGTDRMFVVTQSGVIYVFPNARDVTSAKVFLDIRDRVIKPGGDNGLFSIAFHPRFGDNGEFFVVYGTHARPQSTVVSRFKVSANDPDRADPNSEEVVIQVVQPWPDHNAACTTFGPDGYLYISLGDGGYNLKNGHAQNLSTLLGSVLRIDINRRDHGLNYAIPPDNPFVGVESAREEIWAYGFRAPWRFSFDRVTGDCWLGDNGQVEFEEIDLITRGGNYGWMSREGSHRFDPKSADPRGRPAQKKQRQREPELNRDDGFTDPIVEYDHSQGRSVVGGMVYRGRRLPELIGAYIYADYANGNMWAMRWDGTKVVENRLIARTRLKISSFGEDQQGELLFSAMDGYIYRLRRAKKTTTQRKFPEWLSQTGLFESTSEHRTVAGVIPYSVNVPLWSDGAEKERFIALPKLHSVEFSVSETWSFPIGSVFIKTFSLELVPGKQESQHRLETRLLVHHQRGWAGYVYRWNDDQTDAYLLGGATTETLEIHARGGEVRRQSWYYPSRADCMICHTRAAGFVLGGNTRQLNRSRGNDAHAKNQLDALKEADVFREPPQKQPAVLPSWHDWNSRSGSPSERARAYLDVNCATCHAPPGYTKLDLRWDTPLNQTQTIDRDPEKPRIGPTDSKIVVPGDADRSELYLRMIHRGVGRMPNIASSEIDEDGLKSIKAWIESLDK